MTTIAPDLIQEQYIVDGNGNKTAVILSIELYEQMLEDIHDLAIVAERLSEPSISLAEMKKMLSSHEPLSNLQR
jgi:PHD/YefM family antitoxin component YafN of YafNO toxin-antitoxin module